MTTKTLTHDISMTTTNGMFESKATGTGTTTYDITQNPDSDFVQMIKGIDSGVKSVSVNNSTPINPDTNGNVNIAISDDDTMFVTSVNGVYPTAGNSDIVVPSALNFYRYVGNLTQTITFNISRPFANPTTQIGPTYIETFTRKNLQPDSTRLGFSVGDILNIVVGVGSITTTRDIQPYEDNDISIVITTGLTTSSTTFPTSGNPHEATPTMQIVRENSNFNNNRLNPNGQFSSNGYFYSFTNVGGNFIIRVIFTFTNGNTLIPSNSAVNIPSLQLGTFVTNNFD